MVYHIHRQVRRLFSLCIVVQLHRLKRISQLMSTVRQWLEVHVVMDIIKNREKAVMNLRLGLLPSVP